MINIGDDNISGVYIGDTEISVYVGDVQIYPMNFGTLTGITLDNLTWITDVPSSGGTATSANCSFIVTAHYDSGKTRRVTNQATVTGSLVVPSTTASTRELVGTLTLTASCSGFTDSDSVNVYQEAYHTTPVSITANRTFFVLNYTGSSSTKMHIVFKPHTGGMSNQNTSSDRSNTYIMGRSYTGSRTQFSVNCYYNSYDNPNETKFRFRYYAGNSYNDNFILNCDTDVVYDVTLSPTGCSISAGGSVLTSTTFSNTYTTSPLYLLGGTDGESVNGYSGVMTLYSFEIYENDVLVKNYIPWEENGYGCVKETISDTVLQAVDPTKCVANYN